MTTEAPQFLPLKKPDAGSLIGVHYIMEFKKCPRKWFYRYYQPTQDIETGEDIHTGIEPSQTAEALITGSVFHTALEAYYRSGIRDGQDTGEYKLEPTMAEFERAYKSRQDHYADEELASSHYAMIRDMLFKYFERVGPNSPSPDWPGIKVFCDPETGEPMIEREFVTDLGYEDYFLTSKIDLIILDEGYLKALEHKTSVASYMKSRIASIHHDAQFSGEVFSLKRNLPEGVKFHGVKVNVIQKNQSPNSRTEFLMRETTNRTEDQLLDFTNAAVDTLRQIDDRVHNYRDWLSRGIEPHVALSTWFPVQGTFTGECEAYRRHCDFYALCKNPARAHLLTGNYKARVKIKPTTAPDESDKNAETS